MIKVEYQVEFRKWQLMEHESGVTNQYCLLFQIFMIIEAPRPCEIGLIRLFHSYLIKTFIRT
ncbi:MAG: hypothetical protein HOO86_02175 [Bacteroidales bacterium]|nr:hypothetical protein [Bacteroidales bacterium]